MAKMKYQPPQVVDLAGRTGRGQTVIPNVWCGIGHEPNVTVTCNPYGGTPDVYCNPTGAAPISTHLCSPTGNEPEMGGCEFGNFADIDSFCNYGSIASN